MRQYGRMRHPNISDGPFEIFPHWPCCGGNNNLLQIGYAVTNFAVQPELRMRQQKQPFRRGRRETSQQTLIPPCSATITHVKQILLPAGVIRIDPLVAFPEPVPPILIRQCVEIVLTRLPQMLSNTRISSIRSSLAASALSA